MLILGGGGYLNKWNLQSLTRFNHVQDLCVDSRRNLLVFCPSRESCLFFISLIATGAQSQREQAASHSLGVYWL